MMTSMTLDEIALKYDTDKSSRAHNYVTLYEKYFESLRDKKLKILEIGIQNGYSLKTWEEYFPYAHIYGIDIVDCSQMDGGRIQTLKGSQSDGHFLKFVNDTYGPFDIIIDDGSHNSNDILLSFDFLFPLLAQDGIYVAEDLHCVYWPELADGATAFMDRLKELLDYVNGNGKFALAGKNEKSNKVPGEIGWWEKSIEYIHLYRSIVFIKKFQNAETYSYPVVQKHSKRVLVKRAWAKFKAHLLKK